MPARACRLDKDNSETLEIPLTKDATLFADFPSESAQSNTLLVGTSDTGSYSRILLYFDTAKDIVIDGKPVARSGIQVLCAEIGLAVVEDVKQPAIDMFPLKTGSWGGRDESRRGGLEDL